MTLDLLRHGEPEGGRLYRGNLLDDSLTKKGWQQMQVSTDGKYWDFIATSPMLRCHAFAQHLSQTLHIEMQVFESLKEIGFGDWQGRNVEEIGQQKVNQFKQNPVDNRPSGAEDLYAFQDRVLDTFMRITQEKTSQSVLIIAHAGVIRVIKSYLLNLPIEKMFTIEVASASCESFEI
ncbi:Alpha-ribazole-5'-phosphate phosphatase [Bathymodiolus heckerae thiotrophic gill symbiont]|uniref:histidine phosphatase family protein n=1 Tax=Bathymodiolus heckerae thiotrophic gill symbiont TaxID=1052212 RepID=UPI0010AEF965|nr:histidine phosphatase family protein [Bathymodiolus heckerae thiotrophic gill symbiont]SMN13828.1 Alpha-ribazole-5'-phosphate phosphatase [Bathymodiolus heckerae thiotrophic gill symbiont]SMN14659.1 Alpha-ribazole-5'-phosphate phosphatase [uncultured Candidatus Thioglobus sp.]